MPCYHKADDGVDDVDWNGRGFVAANDSQDFRLAMLAFGFSVLVDGCLLYDWIWFN